MTTEPLTKESYSINILLVEDNLPQESSSNDALIYNNVFRSAARQLSFGEEYQQVTGNSSFTYEFEIDKEWDLENCRIIAYVGTENQETKTITVNNAASIKVGESSPTN